MGAQSLLPGAEIPVHRHLHQEEVLFVHKGQGRAVLEGRVMTIVPGMMVHVPPMAWHALRNTGTGLLQLTWTSAPPGIEEFFRELSRLTSPPNATTLQDIATRHGVEFPSVGEPGGPGAPSLGSAHGRHRRQRGRRRRSGSEIQPSQGQSLQRVAPPPPAPAKPVVSPPRRSEGDRGPRPHQAGGSQRPRPAASSSSGAPPPPVRSSPRAHQKQRSAVFRHRRGYVKEAYMGGRWIRVVGEGPVIAPGHERSRQSEKEMTRRDTAPGSASE